jgi:hypothetical protein
MTILKNLCRYCEKISNHPGKYFSKNKSKKRKKMIKFYIKEENFNPREVKDFDFESSNFIYQVDTQDSSGSKTYYSKTKDEAWKSLDYMNFGACYQVYSKLDDVDDMIPF